MSLVMVTSSITSHAPLVAVHLSTALVPSGNPVTVSIPPASDKAGAAPVLETSDQTPVPTVVD